MRANRVLTLIAGPRTYSWQAATWVVLISVGIGFRLNYQPGVTDPILLLAVMAAIAGVTVSVFAVLAAGYSLIPKIESRFIYALLGFLVVILVRAKVGDVLIMEWGIAQESKLNWRLKQATAFGVVSLISIAVIMNLIAEKKQRLQELRSRLHKEINAFHNALSELSEQRIYTIHEMSVESSTAQELLNEIDELLPTEHAARPNLSQLVTDVNYICNILARARQLTPIDIDEKVDVPKTSWVQENIPFLHLYENKLNSAISQVSETRKQLESMFVFENKMWKQAFVSDISRSPTAGTILLRQVLDDINAPSVTDSITRVHDIWKSIVQIATSSAANSVRLHQ